jgi:hypothetical protein
MEMEMGDSMKIVPLGKALVEELHQREPRLIRVAILSESLKRILASDELELDSRGLKKMKQVDRMLEWHGWGPIFRRWYV